MRFSTCLVEALCLASVAVAPALAQERPFVFSVSTPPTEDRYATVHLDTSVGARAADVASDSERAEQRLGVQAALGANWTLLARVALSMDGRDTSTSQQGELIYNVVRSWASHGNVGIGMGMRHELEGTNVLLGRIVAGRSIAAAWRVDGNALFEKPFATGRDGVDLITSAGVARQLSSAVYAGLEMIGEDLEGFWVPNEADGGARLLIGPSLRLSPSSGNWQLSGAGGPIFRGPRNSSQTDAARSLPSSSAGRDFGARASFSYNF